MKKPTLSAPIVLCNIPRYHNNIKLCVIVCHLSKCTTVYTVHTLNQAFDQAVKNELLYSNPCRATVVPKTEKRKAVAMTIEEQNTFENHCTVTTYGNLFLFALNTGMRCGEIVALSWNDINFDKKIICVSKTASTVKNREDNADTKTKIVIDSAKTEKSVREIPMNRIAEKILREQKTKPESAVFVFSSKACTILIERNITHAYHGTLNRANLPNTFTVHTLKHTFATRLLEKGANAKVVSDILGHSSIQVTLDIYSHVMPNMKRDVISLLD